MNWEERKREKKLPPPEFLNDRNHPHHEAAPFYTEDLTAYEYQEAHLASLTDPRNNLREQQRAGPARVLRKSEEIEKEFKELKEKFVTLEAELGNARAKMSLLEKDNEKLQEILSCTNGERRSAVFELEIERLAEESERKARRIENLEKNLKSEKGRFGQEVSELRNQVKQLRDLGVMQVHSEKKNEFQELFEENQRLKYQICMLEKERSGILKQHQEDLYEQENYYKELLESQMTIEKPVEYTEDPEEIEKSQSEDLISPQELLVDHEFNKVPSPVYMKYEEFTEENLDQEAPSKNSQEFPTEIQSNPEEEVEELTNSPLPMKLTGLTSLFDSVPDFSNADAYDFLSAKPEPNFFASEFPQDHAENSISPSSQVKNWFTQEPEELYSQSYTPDENPSDFFNHLPDSAPSAFLTTPRSLFD